MPSSLPADETTVVVVGTTLDPEPLAGRLDTGVRRCGSLDEVVTTVAELPVRCLVICTDSVDGTEATSRLAADHPSLPLVAYATSEDLRVATEVVAAGADEYVAAPAEDEPRAALAERIRATAREVGYERPLPTELFEAVGDPLIVHGVDDDDTILDVNERFCELLGYERTELLGRSIAELTAEDHVDTDPQTNLRRAVERGSYTFEWADRHKDGSVVPVEVTLTTFERDGNQRVLASLRDISERKRRSRRLGQLHEATTNLLCAKSVTDTAAIILDIVESVFDEELVCFWECDDATDSLDPVAASSAIHEMETTVGTTGELPSLEPDTLSMDVFEAGDSRLIEDYGTVAAERAASDAPLGTVLMLPVGEHGVFHVARREVVTFPEAERYQLELLASHAETTLDLLAREGELEHRTERLEQLHESTEEVLYAEDEVDVAETTVDIAERVLDQQLCLVWLYDESGDVLRPVAGTDAAYAFDDPAAPPGELPVLESATGMEVFEAGESRVIDDYGALPESDEPADLPLGSVLMVPLGDYGMLHASSTELGDVSGTERYMVEILCRHVETALDLLARERELERQNERLERFRSTLAHDLRDPLNTANATLSLLDSEVDSEYVSELKSLHDRMAQIVDDVLALTRTEEIDEPDSVRLDAVAHDAWETAGASAEEATLTVAADATVRADRGQLERLLANLFGNAAEHAGPGVSVTIDTCEDGFYVADDGFGIPEGKREAVFESGTSGDADGTGLGLSIVREVTALHGWTVRATESEDGGLRVEVAGIEEVVTA